MAGAFYLKQRSEASHATDFLITALGLARQKR
jgi:hypothetical protein